MIASSFGSLFLAQAVLSVAVALAGLILATAIVLPQASRIASSAIDPEKSEQRLLLLSSLLIGLLAIRLASWFGFYWLLESYVPHIPGAMCPSGVAGATPTESLVLQASRLGVFVIGGWWLSVRAVCRLSQGCTTHRKIARLAIPVFLLVLFDAVSDLRFLLARREGVHVSCCSTVREVRFGPASLLETPRDNEQSRGPGTAVLLSLGGLLAGLCGLLQSRRIAENSGAVASGFGGGGVLATLPHPGRGSRETIEIRFRSQPPSPQRGRGKPIVGALSEFGLWAAAALGLGFLAAAYSVYTEHLSPRLLGLPFHRCFYELLTRTPDFMIIVFLILLGGLGPLWVLSLSRVSVGSGSAPTVRNGLLRLSVSATVIALLMVATHLALAP